MGGVAAAAQQHSFSIQFLPGMLQVIKEHQLAGQQHDNLCGPYWAAILLRSHGLALSPEQVAQSAGSVLPVGDPINWVPKGANPRQDYGLPIPTTERIEAAGTSAQGLINAVFQISEGAHRLLPLKADWSAERVEAVIQLCQSNPEWGAIPLCNIQTGPLWGSNLGLPEAIAYLNGEAIVPPAADWNVGHFVALAGILTGAVHSLIWVGDNYPTLGWQGYYLQPAEAIAQALNRNDGNEGGILLFVSAQHQNQAEQQAREQGFLISAWDNGTPNQ